MGYLLVSLMCYIIGIGSMVLFFWYIQFSIDDVARAFSLQATLSNTALFLIFPLQHSLLARPFVKERIQKIVPKLLERSIYVGTSGIAMLLVLWGWKPFGPLLYNVEYSWPFDLTFYVAIVLILLALRTLNHTTMFGLRQGYLLLKGKELPPEELKTSGLYEHIRHPLTSLLIVALWAHESMTLSHLQWNLLFTAYSVIGTIFEEKDLIRQYGQSYLDYRRRVPSFLPSVRLK